MAISLKSRLIFLISSILLAVSLILLALFYLLPRQASVTVEAVGLGGGGCGNIPFYDSKGYAYEPAMDYKGPAPLYRLDITTTEQVWPDCIYKTYISPTIVIQQGVTFYPIQVTASLPSYWIRNGESIVLSSTVSILNEYQWNGVGYETLIPWKQGDETTVSLSIDAPNFNFSPTTSETTPTILAIGEPASQQWVIAPKENASGSQIIMVNVNRFGSTTANWFAFILLEVRPVIGVNAIVIAVLAAIGSVLSGIVGTVKGIIEIREKIVLQKAKKAPVARRYSKGKNRRR